MQAIEKPKITDRHAPVCNCTECGFLVNFHDAKYAWDEDDGYLPFCPSCYAPWFCTCEAGQKCQNCLDADTFGPHAQ